MDCCGYTTFNYEGITPTTSYPPGSYMCSLVTNNNNGTSFYENTGFFAVLESGGCTNSYFVQVTLPLAQVKCPNCVGDPINPGVGNVFETETDVRFAGSSPIAYQRFYNSADTSGSDGVPGWRHSYDRSVTHLNASLPTPYPATLVF